MNKTKNNLSIPKSQYGWKFWNMYFHNKYGDKLTMKDEGIRQVPQNEVKSVKF